jgi:hypothetical protein
MPDKPENFTRKKIILMIVISIFLILMLLISSYDFMLYHLIRSNNLPVQLSLLINPSNCYKYNRGTGFTAMHIAAEKGNVKMIAFILKLGVAPDIRSEKMCQEKSTSYKTPLMIAAEYEQTESAAMLLANGADMHEESESENTAFITAMESNNTKMTNLFIETAVKKGQTNTRQGSIQNLTVRFGKPNAVKRMRDVGLSFREKDNTGITPLQLAEEMKKEEIIWIIETGK